MSTKATEKIIDALAQLLEGYNELQESLKGEYGVGKKAADDEDAAERTLNACDMVTFNCSASKGLVIRNVGSVRSPVSSRSG